MSPQQRKPTIQPFKGHPVSVGEPLEFLRATTYKQRHVCKVLADITDGNAKADDIIETCQFLSVDFLLHLLDEAEDVAPLLRARCKPHDKIETVLEDLIEEHELVRALGVKVARALMAQMVKSPETKPTKALRENSSELLRALRRLSAIENAIILPMARARFTNADLDDLALKMAKRRGWAT